MFRVRVAGILIKDNKLLLIEHTKNSNVYYLLPGGGVEPMETLKEALIREFKEELGMDVSVANIMQVVQSVSPSDQRNILHVNFKVSSSDEPRLTEMDGRLSGFKWLNIDDYNTQDQLTFYPPVLKGTLELLQDSTYNGVVLELPEWQD